MFGATFPAWDDFRYNSGASSPAKPAPLAQLDRASGYEPEGREFESLRAHHSSFLNSFLRAPSVFFRAGAVIPALRAAMPAMPAIQWPAVRAWLLGEREG